MVDAPLAKGAGFGCLFSVVFRDPRNGQRFYDALNVSKGPGFGTNFTLSCPCVIAVSLSSPPCPQNIMYCAH